MKCLSKGYIVAKKMQKGVMREKDILVMLDSIFIVKLYETYNHDDFLYFLLEPALGGELFDIYVTQVLHGSVPHAKFYVAGVLYAMEHMHSKFVIYRDLK